MRKGMNRNTMRLVLCILTVSFLAFTQVMAGPVPDTGQTESYTNTFGEDSDYNINPPSYTKLDAQGNELPDNAAEWVMVRDNVTGLIWEVKTDNGSIHDKDNKYTWTDMGSFIDALNAEKFGGHSDWRMPNREELQSIVDCGRYNPAIDTGYFPNTVSSHYWSSDTSAGYTSNAWYVYFYHGHIASNYKSNSYYVRAVRAGQSGAFDNLVINGDGTITDTSTGLMWQQQEETASSIDWEAALGYCENLSLGGYDDWRLPTIKELASIADPEKYNPAIDTTAFPDTVSSYYWSSSTTYYTGYAWLVYFSNGNVNLGNKSDSYYVRAVRAGQCWSLGHLVISAPEQASIWGIDNKQLVTWDTQEIEGNVKISLSRQGGKAATFEIISESTENDGSYEWTVNGAGSFNCVMKIEPLNELDKCTTQGLFSIVRDAELSGTVTDLSTGHPLSGVIVSTIDDQNTQTNSQGYYALGSLTPDAYDITFSKTGYQTVTISDVIITAGQGTELNIELTPPGLLNILTTALPVSETGVEYNPRVKISGGVYPYTYSIAYCILPPGLSLDPARGNIAGIPTTPGSYTFSIGITDAQSAYAEREFTIEVTEKLEIITNSTFPRGTRGTNYFFSIEANGGTLPHTFAKISGSLPSGISILSSCNLSGTPYSTGSYDFTVRVTDASSRTAEKTFHLEIVDPLILSTSKLNNGITSNPYNQTLSSSGGYGNHLWAVYSGTLPAGLSLDTTTGSLSGTPTEATYGTVVFSVSDEEWRITYKDLTLQIADSLQILTTSLPNGLRDEPYSEAIRLAGGIGSFTFSYAGQLPAGLFLNSSTGIISGTPTTAGFTNVSITVTDSTYPTSQSITQNLSIRTTSQLTILTSAVLPKGKKGMEINSVILQAGGGPSPFNWVITGGYLPSGITLNTETGQLSGTPDDKGDFLFTIKVTDADNNTAEKEFFCHISDTLSIVTGAIPDAAKDERYNFTLEAKSGLLPYQWRIKSGTLPTGLSFNTTTGTIYGRPTTRQTYSFTIEVSDNNSPAQTAEHTYITEVLDDLYIYTDTIPNGRLDKAYTATISASLGKPPYSWQLESGVMPPGLTLTGSPTVATLKGTPTGTGTGTGTYLFTIEVSDTGTPVKQATMEYTVNIYGDVIIETTGLKCAKRGVPYSDTIIVSGGKLPYQWQIVEGFLPVGLSLNSTSGHISGITNLISGHSSTFKIRATDSGNPYGFDEKELVIYVIDPLAINTGTIQGAMQKADYAATLEGEGGVSPYLWTISSGTLPEGLTLDPDTGVLSGKPVSCGSFDFTVKLQDTAPLPNTNTRAYQLNVLCCNDYIITGNAAGLEDVLVTLGGDFSDTTTTDADGNYLFEHLPNGNYTITPAKAGYRFEPSFKAVTMNNLDVADVDFTATIAVIITGDIDDSGTVDLKDAIIAFKALCCMSPKNIHSRADVNGDGRIGLEELAYILQRISGLRK